MGVLEAFSPFHCSFVLSEAIRVNMRKFSKVKGRVTLSSAAGFPWVQIVFSARHDLTKVQGCWSLDGTFSASFWCSTKGLISFLPTDYFVMFYYYYKDHIYPSHHFFLFLITSCLTFGNSFNFYEHLFSLL